MTNKAKCLFILSLTVLLGGMPLPFAVSQAAAQPSLHVEIDDGGARGMDDPVVRYTITAESHNVATDDAILEAIVPIGTDFDEAESTPGWSCSSSGAGGSVCSLFLSTLQPGSPAFVFFAARAVVESTLDLYVEASLASSIAMLRVTAEDVTPSQLVDACATNFVVCAAACFSCYFLQDDPACAWLQSPFLAAGDPVRAGNVPGLVGASSGFTLFRLRDRVLTTTRGGQRTTDLYYEHSPAIVNATIGDPSIMSDGVAAVNAWKDAITALIDGLGDTVTITQGQIDLVNAFLDNLRDSASGELAAAIDRERSNIDIDGLVGKTMDDAMEEIESLSCEGYETTLFCGEVTGDCAISATDALLVLLIAVGAGTDVPEADVDGSGAVTASDALKVLRIGVGSDPPTSDCNP